VRILLDYRPALRHRTGVGEYAHELARALVATSPGPAEELLLFSSSWKDRLPSDAVPGATVIDRKIPVRALNLAWHRLGRPRVERLAGRSVDIAHSFHPLLLPASRAAQVITIHDLDFLDHPKRTRAEIRRDYPALAQAHARRAHHVVVNSQTTGGEVQRRFGVDPGRITVCYPGAPSWTPRREEPEQPCLLFLGALEPRKNVGVLLEAYRRLLLADPVAPPLVLAGPAGADSKTITAHAADRPLAGRVEFPGYIPNEQREALFKRALIFIMPSHTEGFGMPVLEAMTAGAPVLVADRGALPEVIGDAGLRFEPDDAEGLQRLLRELLDNPARRQELRERGWRRARDFDWKRSAMALRSAWQQAHEARARTHG
jgi:glycosyltransferase involved in cell wall biosynthesis